MAPELGWDEERPRASRRRRSSRRPPPRESPQAAGPAPNLGSSDRSLDRPPPRERSDTEDAAPRHRRGLLRWLALGPLRRRWRSAPLGTFFPAQPVDGPSPDIRARRRRRRRARRRRRSDARQRDGGEDHVFASLIDGGMPQGSFRVDGGQGPLHRAARRGDRERRAHGDRLRQRAPACGSPSARRRGRHSARRSRSACPGPPTRRSTWRSTAPATSPGPRAATSAARTWRGPPRASPRTPRRSTSTRHATRAPAPALSPRVTASADGIGLVAWGERDAAGITHVIVRRLVRDRVSAVAAEANAATIDGLTGRLGGHAGRLLRGRLELRLGRLPPAGDRRSGPACTTTRAIARRLRGSAFDDAATIDGGAALGAGCGAADRPQRARAGHRRPSRRRAARSPRSSRTTRSRRTRSSAAPSAVPVAARRRLRRELRRRRRRGSSPRRSARGRGRAGACWRTTSRSRSRRRSGPTSLLSDPALGPVVAAAGLDADVDARGRRADRLRPGERRRPAARLAAYDRVPGAPAADDVDGLAARASAGARLGRARSTSGAGSTTRSCSTASRSARRPPTASRARRRSSTASTAGRSSPPTAAARSPRGETRNLRIDATPPKLLSRSAASARPASG